MKSLFSTALLLLSTATFANAAEDQYCRQLYGANKQKIDSLGISADVMNKEMATFQGTSLGTFKHFVACANNHRELDYVSTRLTKIDNVPLVAVSMRIRSNGNTAKFAGKIATWRFTNFGSNLSIHSFVGADGATISLTPNPILLTSTFAYVISPEYQATPVSAHTKGTEPAPVKTINALVLDQKMCGEESICVKTNKGEYRGNIFSLSNSERNLLDQAAKSKGNVCLKNTSNNSGINYFENVSKECNATDSNTIGNSIPNTNSFGDTASNSSDKSGEVCRIAYDRYYISFNHGSQSTDPAAMQIQCMTGAKELEREEVIAFDMQTLLSEAKIEPNNYRMVMRNAMQFACIRNSTGTKGFTYNEFRRSQCGELTTAHKKKKISHETNPVR